ARTLAEARGLLVANLYDLILLETQVQDGTGFDFCKELKANDLSKDIPVIFLSEDSSSLSKVQAFSIGGDDYLVKPFDVFELAARAQARLRKENTSQQQDLQIQKGDLILSIPFQKASLRE